MTTIKATCPQCGDVDLTPRDLVLDVEETLSAPVNSFVFHCRCCESQVRGEATVEVARSLERAGVRIRLHRLPAEVRETHVGPAISEDEVIAFGRLLEEANDPMRYLVSA